LRSEVGDKLDLVVCEGLYVHPRNSHRPDELVASEHRHEEDRPSARFGQGHSVSLSGTTNCSGKVGNVDGRLACVEATREAAAFHNLWRRISRQQSRVQIRCNEAKASFLGKTERAPTLGSAQACCVVDDGL